MFDKTEDLPAWVSVVFIVVCAPVAVFLTALIIAFVALVAIGPWYLVAWAQSL